jgi:two-component system chemotaxis response regulator CheB
VGLAAVHRAGGLTAVQRPDTAVATLMVESALKRTPADLVLSLGELAAFLQTLNDDAK